MNENSTVPAREPGITQREAEIIKALAYGRTPQEIAEAEAVTVKAVTDVYSAHWREIAQAWDNLKQGGYQNGY